MATNRNLSQPDGSRWRRCFTFNCSAYRPHPHSFPTRRSSDLPQAGHDHAALAGHRERAAPRRPGRDALAGPAAGPGFLLRDRKSTRLNSSHVEISYAVFCLKKKNRRRNRASRWRRTEISASPTVPDGGAVLLLIAPPTVHIHTLSLHDALPIFHKLGTTTRPSLAIVSALPLAGQAAMPWQGQQQGQDSFYEIGRAHV